MARSYRKNRLTSYRKKSFKKSKKVKSKSMKRRNNRANKRRRSMKKRQRGGAEESRKQDIGFQKKFLLTGEIGTKEKSVIKKFVNNKKPLEFIFYIADNHTDPEFVENNVGILEEFKKDKLKFDENIIQKAVIKCIEDIIDEIKLIYGNKRADYNNFIIDGNQFPSMETSVNEFKKNILQEYNITRQDIPIEELPKYKFPPDFKG